MKCFDVRDPSSCFDGRNIAAALCRRRGSSVLFALGYCIPSIGGVSAGEAGRAQLHEMSRNEAASKSNSKKKCQT